VTVSEPGLGWANRGESDGTDRELADDAQPFIMPLKPLTCTRVGTAFKLNDRHAHDRGGWPRSVIGHRRQEAH
jgi:hypothetical protein